MPPQPIHQYPYQSYIQGYLELNVLLCSHTWLWHTGSKGLGGASVPGVLGMNFISKRCEFLFGQNGPAFGLGLPMVSQAPGPVLQAL